MRENHRETTKISNILVRTSFFFLSFSMKISCFQDISPPDDDDRRSRSNLKSIYKEPSEARLPDQHWRLTISKESDDFSPYRLYRQSKYLFGRDKDLCDIRLHHSSCSNFHAVIQYRLRVDSHGRHVYPYLIDLGSTSGTYLNRRPIESNKYYKLEENDVIQFGESSKEYILILDLDSGNKYERICFNFSKMFSVR